jgi:WD40 repeat protein
VRQLTGHEKTVRSVNFSSDGKRLASGSEDGTARVWDVASGKEIRRVGPFSYEVYPVALSPDGKVLATGDDPLRPRSWDIGSGRELPPLEGEAAYPHSLAFSPDGKILAAGTVSEEVACWDIRSGRLLQEQRFFDGWVRLVTVVFSPNGKVLATGSASGIIRLLDPATGKVLARRDTDHGMLESLAFSPDGKTLASGGQSNIRLWDAATLEERQPTPGPRWRWWRSRPTARRWPPQATSTGPSSCGTGRPARSDTAS